MPDHQIRAAFYLSPTLDALWRWSEDGEVLTWPDGTTIAFRAEVEAVLGRLAPGGLPPFGAVALLLAACREAWDDAKGRDTVDEYARLFGGMNIAVEGGGSEMGCAGALVFRRVANEFGRLMAGLDAVNRLPREAREGVAAKVVLAEVVFDGSKNRASPDDAAMVIRALDEGVNPETLRPRLCNEESLSQFAGQVDGMSAGLARVDVESLARRAKTGLDDPVKPVEEDLSPPERVRRLLAELRDDPELAGLARLARDLMAAVSVPRTLRFREELAVGGVSDLSNRGPLDRLLVSELANDDLTLAVRVAVNEALYLRRESPPREPPHRRAILLDAGVRMWGVPRVFATAAAMALAATNDPKAHLTVYRAARGGHVEPVDLTTRRGLEAHLGALETDAHPGAALGPFYERLAQGRGGDGEREEPTDAILITHPDALADPAFAAAARALQDLAIYVATVDRGGAFRLLALSRAGQKPVREAKLSLDAVLEPGARISGRGACAPAGVGVPLVSTSVDLSLPAILYADRFPLLVPHTADPRTAAVSKRHGLVAATDDGRLLHWADGRHGARQLTALLPRGAVRLVHVDDMASRAYVLITRGRQQQAELVTAELPGGRCTVRPLRQGLLDPKGVFARGGTMFVVLDDRVDVVSLDSGAEVGSVALTPRTRWMRDRFFRDPGGWYGCVAPGGGTQPALERVPVAANTAVALFDREGFDGPFAVLIDGRVVNTAGGEFLGPHPQRSENRFLGASADGHRILFKEDRRAVCYELDKGGDGAVHDYRNLAEVLLAPEIYWSTRSSMARRTKFRGVHFDDRSGLYLQHRRAGAMRLGAEPAAGAPSSFLLFEHAGTSDGRWASSFHDVRLSTAGRFRMQVATWNDGSRAWLDFRGLLHLKSSDRSVPELSFALTTGVSAAWSSEGKVCGPAYLIGDDARPTEPAYFLDLVGRFVARLR